MTLRTLHYCFASHLFECHDHVNSITVIKPSVHLLHLSRYRSCEIFPGVRLGLFRMILRNRLLINGR